MVDLFNTSQVTFAIITGWSSGVTGSLILTLFFLLLFLVVIGILFKLPPELVMMFTLPVILVIASFYFTVFGTILILFLGILAFVLAKYFFFK